MKKILFTILAICLIAEVSYADILTKVGLLYEAQDEKAYEITGGAVKQDLAGIKNLDIDIFVMDEIENLFKTDDKAVLTGFSYNYDFNEKFSAGIGIAAGIKRFEKIEANRIGEAKYGIYIVGGYKF